MFSFSSPVPCRRTRPTRFAAVTPWLLQEEVHTGWEKENLPFPNYSDLLEVGDEKSQQLVVEPATAAAPHRPSTPGLFVSDDQSSPPQSLLCEFQMRVARGLVPASRAISSAV